MTTPPSRVPLGEGSRTRAALFLLGGALALPALTGVAGTLLPAVGAVRGPVVALGVLSLVATLLAVAAAATAPVEPAPRAAVIGSAVVTGGASLFGELPFVGDPAVPFAVASAAGAALFVATAWLGLALGRGLDPHVERSWRGGLLVAAVVGGLLLLVGGMTSFVVLGEEVPGGLVVRLVIPQVVFGLWLASTVHLVVCVARSVQALEGGEPRPPRAGLLAAGLVAGALWGVGASVLVLRSLALS